MDLGPPISYRVLEAGTPVLSSDGAEIGEVAHVLADEHEDVFDGIVISEPSAPGKHRFADADDVQEIHEHAVVLKLDREASAQLPEPTANPAVMREDPGERPPTELADKLRRAWNFLSGNY